MSAYIGYLHWSVKEKNMLPYAYSNIMFIVHYYIKYNNIIHVQMYYSRI